jgi:hypothetical protein
MNVSFRSGSTKSTVDDHKVVIHGQEFISKLMLKPERTLAEIEDLSDRLTYPYQLFVTQAVSDLDYLKKSLAIVSGNNPHTPFEIVFLEPTFPIHTTELLSVIQIKRPHYLDNDLRFLYGLSGNRCVVFTVVSTHENLFFYGEMKRQVFWWKRPALPEQIDLDSLSGFSGILIDTRHSEPEINKWQDQFAGFAPDIQFINFVKTEHQKRWISLTAEDDYYMDVL